LAIWHMTGVLSGLCRFMAIATISLEVMAS